MYYTHIIYMTHQKRKFSRDDQSDPKRIALGQQIDLKIGPDSIGRFVIEGSQKVMYKLIYEPMIAQLKTAGNVLAFKYFEPKDGIITEYGLERILYELGPLNKEFIGTTPQILGGFKLDEGKPYTFVDRDKLIESFARVPIARVPSARVPSARPATREAQMAGIFDTLFIIEELNCFEAVKTTYNKLIALVDTIMGMGYCWTDIKIENICQDAMGNLKIIDLDPEFLFRIDYVLAKFDGSHDVIIQILENYMLRQLYSTLVPNPNGTVKPDDKQPEIHTQDIKMMEDFIFTNQRIFILALLDMPHVKKAGLTGFGEFKDRHPHAMYRRYQKCGRQPQVEPQPSLPGPWPCSVMGGRIKKRRSTHKKKNKKKKPSKKYRSRKRKHTKRR